MKGIQATYATILGAVLLLVGILGFLADGVLLWFGVNALHNLVHLASGAVGLWAGVWGGRVAARWYNRIFGVVYLLVAVLGFLGMGAVLLHLNGPDHWLHVLIGVASLSVGFGVRE